MEDQGPKEEHITVAVRIRPFVPREITNGISSAWELPGPTSIKEITGQRFFVYDRVYEQHVTTEKIFDEQCEKIIWKLMEGFNGCIFCYGQTGSGKTFTMHGSRKTQPGFVPLTIDTIFAYIQQTPDKEFLIRCSYLEIYNENINDLLNPNGLNLQVQEDKKNGIKIVGATEEVCSSINQVNSLLYLGETHKQFASTEFNSRSSRSHCIFRIIVESKSRDPRLKNLNMATLNLIDLAGSESAAVHGPTASLNRTREMKYINRSLLTLATVIMRLSDKANSIPVPYRDSKLTRLLRPALEGESKVVIICNISPSLESYDETLSTLKFAQRAKKIKQTIKKNVVRDNKALIMKYEAEIEILQEKLREMESKFKDEAENQTLKDEIWKMSEKLMMIQDEKEMLDAKLETTFKEKLQLQSELERLRAMILVSENINKADILEDEFVGADKKNQEKRRLRLSIMRDGPLTFEEKNMVAHEIIHEEEKRNHTVLADLKAPDIDLASLSRRETNLLDGVERIPEILEKQEEIPVNRFSIMISNDDPKLVKLREVAKQVDEGILSGPSRADLLLVIEEQDKLNSSMQKQLDEKDQQISILKDELQLCRNNLISMQKQLKEYKRKEMLN